MTTTGSLCKRLESDSKENVLKAASGDKKRYVPRRAA